MNTSIKPNCCPCGSDTEYSNCCGLYISNKELPETPEQLMRSRYTAYTLGEIDYVFDTMRDDALVQADRAESLRWAKTSKWLGLEIVNASDVDSDSTNGEVKFIASYIQNNQRHDLKEHSQFKKYDGRWYYIGGVENYDKVESMPQVVQQRVANKIGRNDPCSCGSGKKYKKCCL